MKGLSIYSLVCSMLVMLFVICMVCVFEAHAQLPLEPTNAFDALALIPTLQEAVEQQNWAMVVVISLMSLTWLIKRFLLAKDGSQKDLLPAVSAGLGTVLGTAVAPDPVMGAMGGLMLGNAASGMYDVLKRTPRAIKKKKVSE